MYLVTIWLVFCLNLKAFNFFFQIIFTMALPNIFEFNEMEKFQYRQILCIIVIEYVVMVIKCIDAVLCEMYVTWCVAKIRKIRMIKFSLQGIPLTFSSMRVCCREHILAAKLQNVPEFITRPIIKSIHI